MALRHVLIALTSLLPAALPAAAQAPLLTLASPVEDREGHFGQAVSATGDADGDGRADLLVGAPNEAHGVYPEAGHAYVFRGGTDVLLHALVSASPEGGGRFGEDVALIGDVDGDGLSEFVVGAPGEGDAGLANGAGRAYVFSGGTGLVLYALISPNAEARGEFGVSVAAVGDADGDGVPDVLVGAFDENLGASPDGAGRAYLFSGADGTVIHALVSPDEELLGRFGTAVAGVGDLDGDGRPDLLVGATGERGDRGQAHAFSGATGALLRTRFSPNAERGGHFGVSVAGVGDADLDGVPDVLVGANGEDVGSVPEAGRAYLFSGADGVLLRTLVSPGPQAVGEFGGSVSGAADQDVDGRADLLVGANGEDAAGRDAAGRAHAFSGGTGSWLFTLVSPTPTPFGLFGIAVALGDVSGDGGPDLIVGASRDTPAGSPVGAGRAHAFSGADPLTVTVDIEPVNPPVVIGPGGGSFAFTVVLWNQTSQPQTFQAWTAVGGPVSRSPVLGPQTVTLPAGGTTTRTLTQRVPANVPAGTYTYTANVGTFPGVVLYSDAFVVTKLPAREGASAAPGASDDWRVSGWEEAASAAATSSMLGGSALSEVYPNPSNATARLTLDVAEAQAVRVEAYDGLGRRVALLHDGPLAAGAHVLAFDGSALPSGVYVLRATGETFTATRRATLVR